MLQFSEHLDFAALVWVTVVISYSYIVIYSVFLHQYDCIQLQFVGIYGWALTFLEREERRHLATHEKGGEYATVDSSRLIKVILDDDLDFRNLPNLPLFSLLTTETYLLQLCTCTRCTTSVALTWLLHVLRYSHADA